jgi:hypothetical protein
MPGHEAFGNQRTSSPEDMPTQHRSVRARVQAACRLSLPAPHTRVERFTHLPPTGRHQGPPAAGKFRSGGILFVAVRIHLCHRFSARSLQHFSATLTLLRSADTRLARPKRKRND